MSDKWEVEEHEGQVALIAPDRVDELCDDVRLELTVNASLERKKLIGNILVNVLNAI